MIATCFRLNWWEPGSLSDHAPESDGGERVRIGETGVAVRVHGELTLVWNPPNRDPQAARLTSYSSNVGRGHPARVVVLRLPAPESRLCLVVSGGLLDGPASCVSFSLSCRSRVASGNGAVQSLPAAS
jgi:hypothetical protein